jgi:ABC-type uncharacterized transport system permease subunit
VFGSMLVLFAFFASTNVQAAADRSILEREGACMLTITFAVSMVGYLTAALLFYAALVRVRPTTAALPWAQRLLVGTAMAHAADIVTRALILHKCPVLSAAFALSLAAWVTVVGFLVWARSGRLLSLGVIVSPLAMVMMVVSLVLQGHTMATEIPGWFLAIHVLANLSAVALFVLSAAAAFAHLFLSRRLKSKRPALAQVAFPGLSTLEGFIQRTLTIGLGPMTLGVVSGAVFAERLTHGGIESLRIGLAYSSWLLVAGIVVGQRLIGWSGRKLALGALLAAATAIAVVVLYAVMSGGSS